MSNTAAGKEILLLVDALSNLKSLSRDVVFQAAEEGIRAAIETANRKKYGAEMDFRVLIDRMTGVYEISRYWQVVDEGAVTNPELQLSLSQAQKIQPACNVGDEVSQPVKSIEYGRIASRMAKQSIMKKIREAETARLAESYRQKIGELLIGTVQRVTRDNIFVDLGNGVEGIFPREELLPREAVRSSDRLRGYLYEVRTERGMQLMLSRIRPAMLMKLFEVEVPEIAEQLIEIKAAARDPGIRAKIAVKTNDKRIDPIGACVGMRGARVQAVSGELGGERIDIILWDDNPAQLVINALAPAEVSSIIVDEDAHTIDVAVEEDQLSQAIGKNGQNVRLASQLTGWTINIMSKTEAQAKHQAEADKLIQMFVQELGVDEEVAALLNEQGFTSMEEIAYVPASELLAIEGFDEEIIEALRTRAKDILLTRAIASEELQQAEPAADLVALPGMRSELAYQLAAQGIVTREDLADQAVMDLLEVIDIEASEAAELIMQARASWFNNNEK